MKNRALVDADSLRRLQEKKASLTKIESLQYSENLRSVMDASVYTSSPGNSVKEVVKEMSRRGISSVIVVDDDGLPVGILTERDIMRRIVAVDGVDMASTKLSDVMTRNPITHSPDDTIYRALSTLSAKGIKHLPLVEDGKVIGMVTLRQLLKLKYPEPMVLVEEIRDASDAASLKEIKEKVAKIAAAKMSMGIRAYDIVVMLSLINHDIHRKTLELAIRKHGEPPSPICLYVTGSHGRLENLLTPDQDHGMIIADSQDPTSQYAPYYTELTETFSKWLDEIGFETCPGYIMSVNPIWRKSLSEWKLQIQYWFEKQVRELGRYVTVLFDATPIYGDNSLFAEVNDFAFALLSKHHEVLRVLHEEEGRHRVPTGLLGRFITEREGEHRGELNIKRSGLIFVVEGIRILSLLHGIRETSTLKRIASLVAGGFIHKDDGEYFESAYHYLLHLALSTQLDKALMGEKIDNFINPNELSARDRETLKHAYKAVSSLQDLVASEFGELVI